MGGMLARLITLVAYVCVASLITEVAGAVYLRVSGKLDDARIDRILAAAQGLDANQQTGQDRQRVQDVRGDGEARRNPAADPVGRARSEPDRQNPQSNQATLESLTCLL